MGWGKAPQSCSQCMWCLAWSCTSERTPMGNSLLQVQKGSGAPFISPFTLKGWLVNPCCRSAIKHAAPPSAPQPFLTCRDTRKSCDVYLHSTLGALLPASSHLAALAQWKSLPQRTLYPHGEEVLFNCLIPTAKWKIKTEHFHDFQLYISQKNPWYIRIWPQLQCFPKANFRQLEDL